VIDIESAGLAEAVGPAAHARGVTYVQQRAVVRALWDPHAKALRGAVRGRSGAVHMVTAHFSSPDGRVHRFGVGECTCPVESDCEHVAALVLSVTGVEEARTGERPRSWERSLASLLDSRPTDQAGRAATPLAIELTLSVDPAVGRGHATGPGPGPRLQARVVRRGKAGWVGGGLSWSQLGNLQHSRDLPAAQVRLLQELYALYKSRGGRAAYSYTYGYGDEKRIDLSAFESSRLWPLLDEAEAIGLRLVHARKQLGPLEQYRSAELCLDITSSGNALAITPAVAIDGAPTDVMPILFIGTTGHGLVFTDRAAFGPRADLHDWPLRIARLVDPAPRQLQRLVLEAQRLEVPDADRSRFRDEYYPRLRHMARVISSDESFTPPAISDPILVLRASYGTGHDMDLSWEWVYEVGASQLRAPLIPPADPGYRDLYAEGEVIAHLDVGLEEFGLRSPDAEEPLAPRRTLTGIDTVRFTTEVLPLLDGHPGVIVEISGEPADYREAGDSLRIGVSTSDVAGETDWFDLGVTITVEGRAVPFADVFVALSHNESYLLLADGAYFSLEKPELQALRRMIDEARALQDRPDGPLRISRFQADLWDELAELGVVDRQAQAWQRQVGGLLELTSVEPPPQPAALSAQLRTYQTDGFGWLAFLWEHRLGGILADDMGLGKTLQSLALICHAKQAGPGIAPFLIVAPTSVVANWAAEAERFAPELTVVPISDTLRRRGQDLDEVIVGADVVVTSYTLFRLDFEAYCAQQWSGLLLDEAQFVKNHQSKAYQCARQLPAQFKLAITGTPMENNLMELWSLLSITAPGLFPNPNRFREYYARPIEKDGDGELLAQLRRRIRPLVKRRTKEQVVADLPAKQEQVLEVDLHPRHRATYQRHLQRERQKVLGLIDDVDRNRFTILRSLTLLRRLSLHAGLIDDEYHELPSTKIDTLLKQLRDVTGGGHRALVFSQFTGFLEKVRARLDAEGVAYCYLDGKTRNRAAAIKRFKDGAVPVFLISLKAGGFGLNLTEADYCFLLDPWWNPATEAQAVDRTHRIGQTRNVMVYRLVAKDTIEEKVMALKARKAELFSSVMDDGNVFGATLEAEDIRELLA
jgi:superfamily II DNA or RNA helicase